MKPQTIAKLNEFLAKVIDLEQAAGELEDIVDVEALDADGDQDEYEGVWNELVEAQVKLFDIQAGLTNTIPEAA